MKATIESESDRTATLTVSDSEAHSHRLVIDRTGTIQHHHCDAYPAEPADRTPVEYERCEQVQRFAKYALFRRRGDNVLSPYDPADRIAYPERIAATTLIVGAMSLETVESTFDSVYRQLSSATGADATADNRPVQPPAEAPDANWTLLEQDLALRVGDDRLRPLFEAVLELEALGALRQLLDERPERDDQPLFARLNRVLEVTPPRADGRTPPSRTVPECLAEPSAIRVHWQTDGGTRVTYGDESASVDAPLAARLQLPAAETPIRSVASLQRSIVDHLLCQLRDCYVGMGLAPPRGLRVRGPGIAAFTDTYEQDAVYQRYHDPDAIIDWTRLSPNPF
ncbi:hypothetical protein G6M89_03230 [Natronolimnobius sp. AArcel1]|uniref:hypothetical protein n=1 Tax=Natronolimnobius sp. AArcel1 TaxID=1679093 RepID=UPI0013EDB618|nr:hypothetical protein [Natronolimnobius sp. AArcel1]NGM68033.1 hypothetical protein [Natronolimnobius sp. AArcel1]